MSTQLKTNWESMQDRQDFLQKRLKNTALYVCQKGGKSVKLSQLMMLMSLGAKQGDLVKVTAEGEDEDTAIAELEKFFNENL